MDKKQIAAISGVIALLNSEATTSYIEPVVAAIPSPWSSNGRQQTMIYRDITQRRIIKRTR